MFKKKEDLYNFFFNPDDMLSLSPEVQLFFRLMKPLPGDSVLSIGTESHEIIKACLEINLDMSVTDSNKNKLNLTLEQFKHKLSYYESHAEDLPFEDNSFEYSFFFNSLGLTRDPVKALEESFRVTKNYVFIGILNRYAIKGVQKTIMDFLYPDTHKSKLFSVFEIKQIIKELLGDVPVKWRTVSTLDFHNSPLLKNIGYSDLIQKSPFGNFAGISVNLTPRFTLKPLDLKIKEQAKMKQLKTAPQRCIKWNSNFTNK
ncbi:MAG: class I SAM-dependent methyltransferase [Thermodesulfobacteriota bacterium]